MGKPDAVNDSVEPGGLWGPLGWWGSLWTCLLVPASPQPQSLCCLLPRPHRSPKGCLHHPLLGGESQWKSGWSVSFPELAVSGVELRSPGKTCAWGLRACTLPSPAGSPVPPTLPRVSPAQAGPTEKKIQSRPHARGVQGSGQCCLQDGVTSHHPTAPTALWMLPDPDRSSTAMTGGSC